jgi:hypothetical protein
MMVCWSGLDLNESKLNTHSHKMKADLAKDGELDPIADYELHKVRIHLVGRYILESVRDRVHEIVQIRRAP